ncbi:hypothetical protein [Sphingomicrobium astaxanthinifaciens]|uniref:hypothetical protein n=1 Tax=Sphingomicrobium astaxanthinifaciens TaxID=1227949 RepID=UPI001FCB5BA8|nr:hypothetical protein [Sphingomicrobium astaxanthinifaciens]MCJ7421868.1 hypothetical protein [Sphingomicrobium astaxanthinifaciens]
MRLLVNILFLAAAAISLPWLLDGYRGSSQSAAAFEPGAAGFCQLSYDQIAAGEDCRASQPAAAR